VLGSYPVLTITDARAQAERVFKYTRAHGAAAKSNPAVDAREAMQALSKKKR